MIHIITGRQGSGKTLLLVKKAIELHKKGYKIYSNFHINSIPYGKIVYQDIIGCKYFGCALFLDEVHLLLPSREWFKKTSRKIVNSFISQVRKQELELYCSTQQLLKVDNRLRGECDFVWECQRFIKKNNEFIPVGFADNKIKADVPTIIKVEVYDKYTHESVSFSFMANELYDKYDTKQIVKIEGLEDDE